MIHKVKDKVWHDHRGNKVPVEYVPDIDRRTEVTVGKIIRKAESLSQKLAEFKAEAYEDCDKLYNEMLKNANIAPSERKGNYTITSFDKSVKIEVNVSDRIDFDENIEFAQMKLQEFIEEKTATVDLDVAELVNNAFKTRRGRLDTKRVLSLFTYKITHPKWVEAIELIKKSITTNSSVRYMDFSVRNDEGRYIPVKLNFSTI